MSSTRKLESGLRAALAVRVITFRDGSLASLTKKSASRILSGSCLPFRASTSDWHGWRARGKELRMATGKREHSATAFHGLGLAAMLILAQGCMVGPSLPPVDVEADLAAIVAVLNDAYRTRGFGRPVLFLDTGNACESVQPPCVQPDGGVPPELTTQLEADLQVKVRSLPEADFTVPSLTPILPETGEVGVSVSLGRFREEDDGYWHVNATISRSGLDSGTVEYVLERDEGGWAIIEPNITLEDDMGQEDFGATIARLESAIGDLAAIYSICENIPQDPAASLCWTRASQLNPDLRDQICDHMLDHVDYPYEEECRWGVVWPLGR